MAKFQLAGSYVALITPFTDDDQVDYAKIEELVDWHVAEGTNGILPCGTTGESPTLSDEETRKVIETVVKKAAGRCQVIGGGGSNCTAKAVKAAQMCKDLGCDVVLSVIPYYNKPTQDGLYAHFEAVSKVGIPIMLYNIPGRCGGGGMTSATIAKLWELPTVCCIKEATGSVDFASEIRSVCDIQIFSGDDSLVVPLMSIGGKGVVSVVANLCPRKVADLCKAMNSNDLPTAQRLHAELYKLCKAMFCETNPIPCKAAGAMMGKWKQNFRLPMTKLRAENEAPLKAALAAAGLL
mmetsp:Transcript_71374/g.149021  ORF Transcript_71374/g.149021 Transcript_71374/m.149021 type:complete len:294 (-) Transcript_71374:246-1127(-)|eukprot:CAMPEP_0181288596 /NCGR_PEP_ID=MMETSP1101-20121128/419_1 /TAXON_ID=46948 /ORGANISM="Rhodomonas abbreviata, Strain Caron Lab Isolate" /LENGTH=293 /DNA_ID=CAMNT_0023392733 /DNA_START=19 /DNA_END=900 /DNA_ORIENTATION=-